MNSSTLLTGAVGREFFVRTIRLSCSHCGAQLNFVSAVQVLCEYCNGVNYLNYDEERDALGLVRHRLETETLREGLGTRIEVLLSNLDAIDPAQRWPPDGISFPGRSLFMGFGGMVCGAFFISIGSGGFGLMGILTFLGGAGWIVRKFNGGDFAGGSSPWPLPFTGRRY